jgi:hypothetical protein
VLATDGGNVDVGLTTARDVPPEAQAQALHACRATQTALRGTWALTDTLITQACLALEAANAAEAAAVAIMRT